MQGPESRLASNLRHLRRSRGISQSHLADQLGLTRSKVASYENGKAEPSARTLLKLTEYFHLSLRPLILQDLRKQPVITALAIGEGGREEATAPDIIRLRDEAVQLRRVADGYEAMYAMRKESVSDSQDTRLLNDRDVETMLSFIDIALTKYEQCLSWIDVLARGDEMSDPRP
ncbi:MAG: helix-turn-helix transcriptional regulator [Saprospiraceae bacterium]|nr:helix-turn-helix transcriptional regulator [Saprospiraceae bacterium]